MSLHTFFALSAQQQHFFVVDFFSSAFDIKLNRPPWADYLFNLLLVEKVCSAVREWLGFIF
ncbi:hypothetical protein A2331_02890 [Candidatus Falkowbacteria bacterium RIFOXYB2_FULL_34_18]|uniref:Uncharacterized protein n=1 Tax=Candidatus Falkowbacteria bacterium RIFOXYD2_FULL_34_120 TaxID=1798007 RepID=A0A1F5TMJ7_9BACT|nr:MAG: hypothetical protein A2331_02890 [Candidatus Falkowbacteria bacterium RIFOXYB2_FULL_34_18]OGF28342.1 MAG: hypothetical protein A2500_03050 [Candidatus Falkowbacteria bacterium RIFOXYC12_FULL_34_55]OGF39657.1 MAG: hypothetical protein A2515_07330 [Candidatus Falkowbacteria bacterium RIFOXYD12_FULL_34_57]OGF40096.1 MAG: hypothetical protein A2531_05025 [Candidatus Falkowbacteria bacterium RIFOXYD2_FULL_34_120]